LVLILHRPFNSLVFPEIFLNIFLSNTMSFCRLFSLRTHVLLPYVTIRRKASQRPEYSRNDWYIKINSHEEYWVKIMQTYWLPDWITYQWRTEEGFGGSSNPPPPPEIPKYWQSWDEFPVPRKIHP
jgi:hypothetical protein